MKQIFKKMAAGALSICMLFTDTGMQTMAGELNPEEMRPVYDDSESAEGSEEALTNDPERYLVHIPIGEGYQLTYDITHLDNEKTKKPEEEIYLSYEANEEVSVEIQAGEGYSVDSVKVLDSETELEETVQEFKYEESTLTFQMPEKDVDIKVSVTALAAQEEASENTGDTGTTDPETTDQTQTDSSQTDDSKQAAEESTSTDDGTNTDSEAPENEDGTDVSEETQVDETESEEEVDLTDPNKDSAE